MKNQRGITLITLIIYVIGLLIVISIVGTITNYAYKNMTFIGRSGKNAAEYNTFNMYFLEDVKSKTNKLYEIQENQVTFSDGTAYVFKDEAIYRNNIRICENISDLKFSTQMDENTKNTIITVLFIAGDEAEFTKTTNYTLLIN